MDNYKEALVFIALFYVYNFVKYLTNPDIPGKLGLNVTWSNINVTWRNIARRCGLAVVGVAVVRQGLHKPIMRSLNLVFNPFPTVIRKLNKPAIIVRIVLIAVYSV